MVLTTYQSSLVKVGQKIDSFCDSMPLIKTYIFGTIDVTTCVGREPFNIGQLVVSCLEFEEATPIIIFSCRTENLW